MIFRTTLRLWTAAAVGALLLCCGLSASAHPNRASAPKILELRVLPAALTLDNARDARRLVVSGRTPDGYWLDLTFEAAYKPAAGLVTRDAEGYFHSVKPGATTLTVTAGGKQVRVPV